MIWFIVDVAASGYNTVTSWMLVNSRSDCLILGNASFDACAIVSMLVRGPFFKDDGRNSSFFFWECVVVFVASKLVTVLTVGYCVRNKKVILYILCCTVRVLSS
jgi:hypothetical protein